MYPKVDRVVSSGSLTLPNPTHAYMHLWWLKLEKHASIYAGEIISLLKKTLALQS